MPHNINLEGEKYEIGVSREMVVQTYIEAGTWARHYRALRAVVPPFLITLSVHLIIKTWGSTHDWYHLTSSVATGTAALKFMWEYTRLGKSNTDYQYHLFAFIKGMEGEDYRTTKFKPLPKRTTEIGLKQFLLDSPIKIMLILYVSLVIAWVKYIDVLLRQ